ncbi:peptide ABC transporter substrate-binding protein [Actinoallomurus acanthiterrae]
MNDPCPREGGTLRLYGPAPLGALDPAASRKSPVDQLSRLFARRLFAHRPEPDLRDWRAIAPVPDLATEIPSTYNMGMGARHTNYVVHLRAGVLWDTDPPRPVTAHDVVRGLKRMCSPVVRPAALPYFTSTIRGLEEFRAKYAAAVPHADPAPEELAGFQEAHDIPGVFVLDEESLVIELMRPAIDFVSIMTLPCAAPAPAEYDAFVPGSQAMKQNLRSNGPYRVARHIPGKELRLEANPAWQADTDPVRHRHVDTIEVTIEPSSPGRIAERIAAGEADLPWGPAIPEPYVGRPAEPDDDLGYALDPYLAFNLRGPRHGGALADVRVRRALAYAINKAAIADISDELRTGTVTRIAGSVVPPKNDAHRPADAYATPGGRGDVERCRAMLAEAGHGDGLTLTAVHLEEEFDARVARSLAADLERAGVTVRLVALGHADHDDLLGDPARAPGNGWDLMTAARSPDWFWGGGRVFLQPMFQSDSPANLGGYRDPDVDALIDRALSSIDEPTRAADAWHEVERRVLDDAAVVPILFRKPAVPRLRGPRVRNAVPMPAIDYAFDLSGIRLDR